MPFYDYHCEANGRTVEVFHTMSVRFKTWTEICGAAGIEPGDTPGDAAVIRLIGGAPVVWKLKGLDKDDYGTKLRV